MGIVTSNKVGNPWHGVKPDNRRELNLKKKKVKNGKHRKQNTGFNRE